MPLDLILVIVLILWLLGWLVVPVGNLIHLLLVLILVIGVIRVMQGRRPLP